MGDMFDQRGSIWRRWDLHLHAPGTKLSNVYGVESDDIWNQFIDELEASQVQVFGITDYFCCDSYYELKRRYAERYPDTGKIFFLNIEFRLSESISRDGSHPDIHVIFDNDETNITKEKVVRFLTNLNTQNLDNASAKKRCIDLTTTADFEAATVSLDSLKSALGETFGEEKPYLLAFPANNNGLRSTDNDSPRKISLADRIDGSCDLFFGNANNREFLLRTDRYHEGQSEPKPVVSGSDAHSFDDLERLGGDVAGFPPTWIKSDTTFVGLKQICYEPATRIYIGSAPDVLVRQEQDGTKFLCSLQVNQIEGYDESNGRWFKDVDLPLNPELTAIIGNKGSGKSAVVDIIGLLGDSRQEDYFSFLTDDSKSKKFRQRGFAENFSAAITWHTGREVQKLLSEKCNRDNPESVEYLPQNYFEKLTNEIEIEQFRTEIEDVVFSHVEETERLGKSSFSELEEAKTQQSKEEISSLKQHLRELNSKIVELENQSSPSYRNKILAKIEEKEEELRALDEAKPKEVSKPDTETEEQRTLSVKLNEFCDLLSSLSTAEKKSVAETTSLKSALQSAVSLKERLTNLDSRTRKGVDEVTPVIIELGLNIEEIVKFNFDCSPVENKIRQLRDKITVLETDSGLTFSVETAFDELGTIPDLRGACEFISSEMERLKEKLSTPQRRYQAYVEKLSSWTAKRADVVGSEDDPKAETLNWFINQRTYIDETLSAALSDYRAQRKEAVGKIYESKSEFLQFYRDIKKSVEAQLEIVRTEGFDIEIEASFLVQRDFRREFLNHINQRKRGPYKNTQEAEQELGAIIRETDWDNFDSVYEFCEGILERMNENDYFLADQAHDVKEFYDFLFSLDYLSSRYELRLGGKNLNELSPGEKGLLLLIFYLQLDQKSTPLIIDQPEDNLDNESIFSVLANCIREAKKRRQVVLVTHNPNLAVGADAEQILYVKLDKFDNYKFSYETGSIENPGINRRIVDVLEGSQPAFVKRRLKYGIK
ncbi:MAG: AAA family ATPase [Pseudohongiellaceae bacterium]